MQGDERFIWNAHVLRDLTAQSEVSEETNKLRQFYRCLLALSVSVTAALRVV